MDFEAEKRKFNSSHYSRLSVRTAHFPIYFSHFAENQNSGITEMALRVNKNIRFTFQNFNITKL